MHLKTWLTLPAVLLTCQLSVAQRSGNHCRWHDQSIYLVNITDYQVDENIFYLLSNNDQYFYLNLIIPTETDQKKLLLFGMTTWLDPDGKTRRDQAVLYPYRRTGRRFRPDNMSREQLDSIRSVMGPAGRQRAGGIRRVLLDFDAVKHQLTERSRFVGLKGFSDTADMLVLPSTNPLDVHGWMVYDTLGMLFYTLGIPLSRMPALLNTGKRGFSIGIESGFFNPEEMSGNRPGAGSAGRTGGGVGRTGGGAGRAGGGRPGGRSRSGAGGRPGGGEFNPPGPEQRQAMRAEMELLSRPFKFWIKNIHLAEKK